MKWVLKVKDWPWGENAEFHTLNFGIAMDLINQEGVAVDTNTESMKTTKTKKALKPNTNKENDETSEESGNTETIAEMGGWELGMPGSYLSFNEMNQFGEVVNNGVKISTSKIATTQVIDFSFKNFGTNTLIFDPVLGEATDVETTSTPYTSSNVETTSAPYTSSNVETTSFQETTPITSSSSSSSLTIAV